MDARRIALAAVLVAVAVFVASAPSARAAPAPPFRLTDIDGREWTTDGLRGAPFLLDFTATWCAPCKIVEAALKELHPSYRDRTVFLSVFLPPENDQATLQNHRAQEGIDWTMAADADDVASRYEVLAIPKTFVIDASGQLSYSWESNVGFSKETVKRDLGGALDRALSGTVSPPKQLEPPFLWLVPAVVSALAGALVVGVLRTRRKHP